MVFFWEANWNNKRFSNGLKNPFAQVFAQLEFDAFIDFRPIEGESSALF